jgi:crossover junction endodeoxyribonuclease RuvC
VRTPTCEADAATRVLGVDPGTGVVGWAVVARRGSGYARVASGVWRLGRATRPLPERLRDLHERLGAAIRAHAPERLALESAFFGRNASSALRLGEARGVVMMTAAQHGLVVEQLPPASVKRRVAGAGAASKEQLEKMVRMHLAEPTATFAGGDESDALAVALCALLQGAAAAPLRAARRARGLPQGARLQ